MPIPSRDFDPSETGIPWRILNAAGVDVIFATPDGEMGQCDHYMLTGKGLGVLAPLLAADKIARESYALMEASPSFQDPREWSELNAADFDGLILPGGHAKGMIEYLESKILQQLVVDFFRKEKPVGAICHGVVLASRSIGDNGQSVLFGKKTTALLKTQELAAWALTSAWLGRYYRTYPQTVEDEVKSVLRSKSDFLKGPNPLLRDNPKALSRGFIVEDGNYISARWPGDAHLFGHSFLKLLADDACS
ncbi:MAG: type 1 glutamine amidotransferase domain-containing protein [Bdellovibrionota bacterium]